MPLIPIQAGACFMSSFFCSGYYGMAAPQFNNLPIDRCLGCAIFGTGNKTAMNIQEQVFMQT